MNWKKLWFVWEISYNFKQKASLRGCIRLSGNKLIYECQNAISGFESQVFGSLTFQNKWNFLPQGLACIIRGFRIEFFENKFMTRLKTSVVFAQFKVFFATFHQTKIFGPCFKMVYHISNIKINVTRNLYSYYLCFSKSSKKWKKYYTCLSFPHYCFLVAQKVKKNQSYYRSIFFVRI